MTPGIDFARIVACTDLAALIERDLGPPDRSRRWKCPFHGDTDAALGLFADGHRWNCFACKAQGTALDWLVKRHSITIVEAARQLDPTIPGPSRRLADRPRLSVVSPPIVEAPKPPPAWQDAEWQIVADRIIRDAEARLWSAEGRGALNWLRRRGLDGRTIHMFRLGFVAEKFNSSTVEALGLNRYGRPQGFYVERGIIIPRIAPGGWFSSHGEPDGPRWSGVKVRRLLADVSPEMDGVKWPKTEGPKFRAFKGTEAGFLYPYDDPAKDVPCLIAEGEMDALIAFQEVGHIVNVATCSGATQGPLPEALAAIRLCGKILIATDYDQAGERATAEWRARFPGRTNRLYLPSGKDITDFVVSGGNLMEWLRSEFRRFGLLPQEAIPGG